MVIAQLHSETFSRGARMLRTPPGPAIATFLEDPSIVIVSGTSARVRHGKMWRTRRDSNARPSPSEGDALSN